MTRWSTVKLADVATLNPTRPRHLSRLDDSHLVTFVPMPAVNQFSGQIDGAQVRPFGQVKKGFTYFAEGDVIFAKITPCMQNGKSAIASDLVNGLGFGSTEFHVIRPNVDRLLPDWVWYFIRQSSFRHEGMRHFRGGVGQQRVSVEYLANATIPLPPMPEQRRIVSRIKACMERVDEIGSLRAASAKEAGGITPSLLNDIFVDVANRTAPVPIEDVALETRYGTSQKCQREPLGVPILRIPNVVAGSVSFDDLKYCELKAEELRRYQLVPGDLLFVRTNGSRDLVGRCAVFEPRRADEPVGFASYLIRVRLDPQRVLPRYLAYFLNSTKGREEINQRRRTSAGQFNINSENLRSIAFPVPPVQEQARLIAMMEERDQLASQLTGELWAAGSESAQLRESILFRAFAGEL